MKRIKKKDKTNNGVMTLLKKLKRHDTMVVAMAVVIALILCGGLIYISTPVVAAEAKEEFIESERENNELTREKLQEIRDYLDELDKVVTSNQNSLNSINEKTGDSKNSDKLHTQSEQIKSDTQKLIVETEKLTTKIDEKVTALDSKLEEVHKDIENTTTKIEELKKEFEERSKSDAEEIKKNFDQISSDLEKIQKQYEEAMKQTKDLNDALAKDIDGKHTALLTKLDEMYKNMEQFNTTAFEGFRNDISVLSSNLTAQIKDIDQDIQNYSNSVDNKFDLVNSKFETINNNVITDIDELKSYLAGEMSSLNSQLTQVFQSVSDGKKLLASTLLTKGVKIEEDATFLEISKAIESIESKVIIEKLEGTVVYDRHYHVDGNEETVEAEIVSIDRKGGCFTNPVYHTHISSCYKTTTYYTYFTDSSTTPVSPAGDDNGVPAWNYKCSYCGGSFRGTNGWHKESASTRAQAEKRGGSSIKPASRTSIVCGKNAKTIDGYGPDCGYLTGQILAAHIDYSKNKNISKEAADAINTSHMMANTGHTGLGLSELTAFDLNTYLGEGADYGFEEDVHITDDDFIGDDVPGSKDTGLEDSKGTESDNVGDNENVNGAGHEKNDNESGNDESESDTGNEHDLGENSDTDNARDGSTGNESNSAGQDNGTGSEDTEPKTNNSHDEADGNTSQNSSASSSSENAE